jgi:hypothetical protein
LHARYSPAIGHAREDAIAELRSIASRHGQLRADLLAQAAGICRGYEMEGGASALQDGIKAGLLVDAGAHPDLIDQWVTVGRERATRAAKAIRGH